MGRHLIFGRPVLSGISSNNDNGRSNDGMIYGSPSDVPTLFFTFLIHEIHDFSKIPILSEYTFCRGIEGSQILGVPSSSWHCIDYLANTDYNHDRSPGGTPWSGQDGYAEWPS